MIVYIKDDEKMKDDGQILNMMNKWKMMTDIKDDEKMKNDDRY